MAQTVGTIQVVATINTKDYDAGKKHIEKGNDELEGSNKKADSSFNRLAKRGLKFATIGMIGLGTAVTAMSLKGGFTRALNIEDAQAKLRGLGHDADNVRLIMDNALSSVRGTAFGLDAAATTAANAVASGVKPGKQLEQVLKTVANTAALAGRDMSDLGAIFNKVAASNKVQMDVINQLHDAGVPALALLSKEIGKTAEETAEMASAGEINFETFERAMRNGVGNASIEMGNTVRGSLANMQAAFSRAGAKVADVVLPHLKDSIQGITAWVDEVAKEIPGAIEAVIGQFSKLRDGVDNAISSGDWFQTGRNVADAIFSAVSISAEQVKTWFSKIDWKAIGLAVGATALPFALGFINGLFDNILPFLRDNWLEVLLLAVSFAFAPAKLLKPITGLLSKLPFGKLFTKIFVTPLRNLGEPVRQAFTTVFVNPARGAVTNIGNIFRTIGQILTAPVRLAIEGIRNIVLQLPSAFSIALNTIRNMFSAIFRLIFNTVTTIFRPIISFFQGIWNGLTTQLGNIPSIFTGAFSRALTSIKNVFSGIGNWFKGRFDSISNFAQAAMDRVRGIFGGVANWIRDRWNQIVNSFSGFGERIGNTMGNAIKGALNLIFKGIEKSINFAVDKLNYAIHMIDNITPGGLPRIDRISLPRLAEGGITTGPTIAMIGEGREQEAVIPLSKLDKMLDNNDNKQSGRESNITINLSGVFATSPAEQRRVAEQIADRLKEVQASRGLA